MSTLASTLIFTRMCIHIAYTYSQVCSQCLICLNHRMPLLQRWDHQVTWLATGHTCGHGTVSQRPSSSLRSFRLESLVLTIKQAVSFLSVLAPPVLGSWPVSRGQLTLLGGCLRVGGGAFHPANMHRLPLESTRHIEGSSQLETASVQGSAAAGTPWSLCSHATQSRAAGIVVACCL